MKRFMKNQFFREKNPTIVNFPVKNLELADIIPVPAGIHRTHMLACPLRCTSQTSTRCANECISARTLRLPSGAAVLALGRQVSRHLCPDPYRTCVAAARAGCLVTLHVSMRPVKLGPGNI